MLQTILGLLSELPARPQALAANLMRAAQPPAAPPASDLGLKLAPAPGLAGAQRALERRLTKERRLTRLGRPLGPFPALALVHGLHPGDRDRPPLLD